MSIFNFYTRQLRVCLLGAFFSVLLLPAAGSAATKGFKMPVVAKWGRFEHSLQSSMAYSNALQEATLKVTFTSPLGEISQVEGFWDGGSTWKVRFSPSQPGHWTFNTVCSDPMNEGLHNQTGEFLCTAATGASRFNRHGLLSVGRERGYLEHADSTKFFWLGDTVWDGARMAEGKDWEIYAQIRAMQGFNAAVWAVAPGKDQQGESAVTGFSERIGVNPEFFRRMDAKVAILSHAGTLSAIVPFLERDARKDAGLAIPDDQIALLVRYVVARWGADPVVWVLPAGETSKDVARWKRIAGVVFKEVQHAPVMVFAEGKTELLNEFKDEKWVSLIGYDTTASEKELQSALGRGGWNRPVIPFTPQENGVSGETQKRFTAEDIRHAAYWNMLTVPPAGITYGAYGVAQWNTSMAAHKEATPDLPMWRKSLFLSGAKQMAHLARFMNSVNFWRLKPEPKLLAVQPGEAAPRRFIATESTEAKDLALAYVPEDRTIEFLVEGLPRSPTVTWFNPRTGETSPAVAVVGGRSCQLPTPEPGDWMLVLKAGK